MLHIAEPLDPFMDKDRFENRKRIRRFKISMSFSFFILDLERLFRVSYERYHTPLPHHRSHQISLHVRNRRSKMFQYVNLNVCGNLTCESNSISAAHRKKNDIRRLTIRHRAGKKK